MVQCLSSLCHSEQRETNILGKIYLFSEIGNKAGLDYLLDRGTFNISCVSLHFSLSSSVHY